MLRIITLNHCPVNLKCHPLKALLHKACRSSLVCVDLNLKSNIKICTGITKKHPSAIPHQINNSQGWYQNVLFSGKVPKPRYKLVWNLFVECRLLVIVFLIVVQSIYRKPALSGLYLFEFHILISCSEN